VYQLQWNEQVQTHTDWYKIPTCRKKKSRMHIREASGID